MQHAHVEFAFIWCGVSCLSPFSLSLFRSPIRSFARSYVLNMVHSGVFDVVVNGGNGDGGTSFNAMHTYTHAFPFPLSSFSSSFKLNANHLHVYLHQYTTLTFDWASIISIAVAHMWPTQHVAHCVPFQFIQSNKSETRKKNRT